MSSFRHTMFLRNYLRFSQRNFTYYFQQNAIKLLTFHPRPAINLKWYLCQKIVFISQCSGAKFVSVLCNWRNLKYSFRVFSTPADETNLDTILQTVQEKIGVHRRLTRHDGDIVLKAIKNGSEISDEHTSIALKCFGMLMEFLGAPVRWYL